MLRAPLPTDALLLLVPRHPQRFDEVAALVRVARPRVRRGDRGAGAASPRGTRVVLGDTMGEMLAYCAAADVAFVGGSLLPLGGQNLIEPIALGVPTLVGPHTFNFAEVTERAIDAGAASRVADADALLAAVAALLDDRRPARRHARARIGVPSRRIAARRADRGTRGRATAGNASRLKPDPQEARVCGSGFSLTPFSSPAAG